MNSDETKFLIERRFFSFSGASSFSGELFFLPHLRFFFDFLLSSSKDRLFRLVLGIGPNSEECRPVVCCRTAGASCGNLRPSASKSSSNSLETRCSLGSTSAAVLDVGYPITVSRRPWRWLGTETEVWGVDSTDVGLRIFPLGESSSGGSDLGEVGDVGEEEEFEPEVCIEGRWVEEGVEREEVDEEREGMAIEREFRFCCGSEVEGREVEEEGESSAAKPFLEFVGNARGANEL